MTPTPREYQRKVHWAKEGNPACLLISAPYLSMTTRLVEVTLLSDQAGEGRPMTPTPRPYHRKAISATESQ